MVRTSFAKAGLKGPESDSALSSPVAIQAIVATAIFHTIHAPVLRRMWSDYVYTMSAASKRADQLCSPGDGLLIVYDIGVISNNLKICRLIDAGALADPSLNGMSLEQIVVARKPRFVLETLGTSENDVEKQLGARHHLISVWQRQFRSHGISSAGTLYTARIFEIAQ